MKTIFDVGMYDAADTAYYLESGYRVVAVEANPDLVEAARRKFAREIEEGRLSCVNAAVSPDGGTVELHLSATDLGSSSLFAGWFTQQRSAGAVTVPGTTMVQLFEKFGVPEYLKVDIEGADRLCILALTAERRPRYASFEVGSDVDELVSHAAAIGYRRFKLVNQNMFREYANERRLLDRVAHRLMHRMGYREPAQVRRAGRFFFAGRSSGPVPWLGDGTWRELASLRAALSALRTGEGPHGWYDIHMHADIVG